MRAAERIHIAVFSFFLVLAWVRRLPRRRRAKVTGISLTALGATLMAARVLPRLLAPLPVSVIRDWLPGALVLLVYWEAGEFFTKVDQPFQDRLERIDAQVIAPVLNCSPGIAQAFGSPLVWSWLTCCAT